MAPRILTSCSLVLIGLCARPQSSFWSDRATSGAATEVMVTSSMHSNGFLLASIQTGSAVVTHYDPEGIILWSKSLSVEGVPPLRRVHTVEFIDEGPGFFLLASTVPTDPGTTSERYYLIEVNTEHEPVISASLEDIASSCGTHFLHNGRVGHAQRIPGQGYLINMPGNPNFNCLCRLDEEGALEWWRLYSAADWTTDENMYFSGFYGCALSDGGILLPNTVIGGFHLHRLNANGEIVWAKKYASGNPYDQAWRAAELSDGSIILTGLHGEDINTGAHWIMLMKLDADGDIIWHRRISTEGSINYPGFPYQLRAGPGGDILIRARTFANGDHLIRCGPDGVVLEMVLTQPDQGYQEGVGIDVLPSSGLIMTGSAESGSGDQLQEAPFLSISPDLGSIGCNTLPVQWIDQVYPTELSVTETGSYLDYTFHQVNEVVIDVTEADWERLETCSLLPAGIHDDKNNTTSLHPGLLGRDEELTLEHTSSPREISFHDGRGAVTPFKILDHDMYRTRMILGPSSPGIHLVRVIWPDGNAKTFKIMVTD